MYLVLNQHELCQVLLGHFQAKFVFLLVLFLLFARPIHFHLLVSSTLDINFFLLLFLTRPIASSSPLPPAWFQSLHARLLHLKYTRLKLASFCLHRRRTCDFCPNLLYLHFAFHPESVFITALSFVHGSYIVRLSLSLTEQIRDQLCLISLASYIPVSRGRISDAVVQDV